MLSFTRSHLSDAALLQAFRSQLSVDRTNTAELLATIAEIDSRKLYLPAGYPSMFAWCVGEWHMSEDIAYKRIERLLAERFPQPDLATLIQPSAPVPSPPDGVLELAPGPVQDVVKACNPISLQGLNERAPAKITPLAPQRFGLQVTIDAETQQLLQDVRALMGHTVPSGDIAAVLRESLRIAKQALEKRRFAESSKPRPGRRTKSARHIPAHVRREVWKRDEGQCTFVSDSGHRCESRIRLEFDHVTPIARGGEATIANLRLRCRAHNQFEAEQVYGERFMDGKREPRALTMT